MGEVAVSWGPVPVGEVPGGVADPHPDARHSGESRSNN